MNHWMIPPEENRETTDTTPFWIGYADLMTALAMLLMVVLSITVLTIAAKNLVKKQERETGIHAVLLQLDNEARRHGLQLDVDRASYAIRFGEKARFEFDSYHLSRTAQERLRGFVPLLLTVAESNVGKRWLKRVHIEGYTDEQGTYLYNVHLSLKRAHAVLCTLFSGSLSSKQVRNLQKLLIIDGAATTGIKETPEESRRVEVRLEFRQLDEAVTKKQAPKIVLGECALPII